MDFDPKEEKALGHKDEVTKARKRTTSIPGLLSWSSVFLGCIFSFLSTTAFAQTGGPTATDQAVSVDEEAAVFIPLNVTPDPDGGALTYTITSQPSNGTLSGVEPNLTYTHDGSETTSDSFSYEVCDPEPLCATATVTITVTPVSDGGPTATDQAVSGDEAAAL